MSDQQRIGAPLVLYDAALGGTPDTQGRLAYRASPGAAATQTFINGATLLDTSVQLADAAGYFADPRNLSPLDRTAGYTLRFTVQVAHEDHSASDKDGDGLGDRAGFSVLVLSADRLGIELGFWQDQIWAQEEGSAEPPAGVLFTRAEHAQFDTTALTSYTLAVEGDAYVLAADERPILRGQLRDYTAFEGPVNPYRTPNFIFLGDDTGSAQAIVRLTYVALTT